MRMSAPSRSVVAAPAKPALRPWLVAFVAVLALLALARPASADPPAIFGVSPDARVTGQAVIWAEARGPSHWMTLRLQGPGTDLEARSVNRRVHLLESAGSGSPLPWNAADATPGTYTLTAQSFFRGRPWNTQSVRFTVGDAAPAPLQAAAQGGSRDVAEQPPASTANAEARASFRNAPDKLIAGVGVAVPVDVSGALPEGGDVLVLAWDYDRRQMVDAFAHKLTEAPFRLNPAKLAQLPVGTFEIQLHVRGPGRFAQTDTHQLTVEAPTASAGDVLPEVSFPQQSRRFTRGDGRSLRVTVDGDIPNNADLLVIAWSLGQGELVERFAHKLERAPWVVPASKLAELPEGQNEVQVLVRRDGQVQRKVAVTVRIDEPMADTSGTPQTPSTPDAPEDDSAEPDNPSTPTTPVNPLPNPDSPPVTNPAPDAGNDDPAPSPVVTPPSAPALNVSFPTGTPPRYVRGSDDDFRVSLDGPLPDGGDVLLLAWHNEQRAMVGAFAHTLRGGDRAVKNGQLDKLPAGSVELQAHLRRPDGSIQIARHALNVVVPASAEPEPQPEPETPVFEPLPDIAAGPGFTSFPLRPGGRAIYVSSSQGNDANAGTSPNAPVRSVNRGKQLLRNGYPDQLLIKAGDTFRGGLGDWDKSGRGSNDKMVVNVYGNGDRPKFYTDGQPFLRVNGNVNHIAFVGLYGYSNFRDPSSPDYKGDRGSPKEDAVLWQGTGNDIHFEDLRFEWFAGGFTLQNAPGRIRNVRIHRCIVRHVWKNHRDGHSSGTYMQGVYDAEITDSLFDHSGWRPGRENERTQFNHNMYMQKDTRRIHVRRSIITRGSHNAVQLRGGGTVEDCLLAYNPYGAFVAQDGGALRRNVVLHGNDMRGDYPLGLGLEVMPSANAVVEDNVIAHKRGSAGWIGAIQVSWRTDIIDPPSTFNVTIRRNRVASYPRDNRQSSIYRYTDRANINQYSNVLDRASGGDTDPPFVDPTRDLDAYARHVGTGNMEGFLNRAATRGRGQWEDRYAAVGANAWIRAGYDFLPYD